MPRSLSNTSKSGVAVDENRKSSSKTLKFKKSITTPGRKSSVVTKNQDRLVGGADVPEEKENEFASTEEVVEETTTEIKEEVTTVKTENGKLPLTPTGGPCCTCLAQTPGSTGDRKVDDMIDYVHQNLQEAGKALAALGENFEHDSKLMFADVFGRIQQWIALVQNKLDKCLIDLEELRKELIARACEIENLRNQLAECEEASKTISFAQNVRGDSVTKEATTDTAKDIKEGGEMDDMEHLGYEGRDSKMSDKAHDSDKVIEIVCTDAAIQSMMKDKDRIRREIELEAEIARLRKENERIIKERAEYENAIQRALLRGVSSLNVEALRVLRCPPIPCCTPCAPCPASATETIVPCKRDAGIVKTCVTQRSGNGRKNAYEKCCTTIKRSCASPCCSAGKSRKSASNNSLLFLLHQGDTDNFCPANTTAVPRVCGSPAMKKIEIPPCPRFSK
ncbi:hypothetical protein ANTRET_LOCUS4081 [Anthophora retusa]